MQGNHKNGKAKVLLVDDHAVVREGIAQIIRQAGGLEICAQADCAEQALQAVSTSKPDMAVLDLGLGASSGLTLIQDLKNLHPRLPLLALSMHDESLYAERVLRAGASGYVMKQQVAEQFVEAVRKVLSGGIYLSARMSERMLQRLSGQKRAATSSLDRLSDRELEVLRLVAQCMSTREIAAKLFLSVKTVETHLDHIKTKLGLESGRELFRYAIVWSMDGG